VLIVKIRRGLFKIAIFYVRSVFIFSSVCFLLKFAIFYVWAFLFLGRRVFLLKFAIFYVWGVFIFSSVWFFAWLIFLVRMCYILGLGRSFYLVRSGFSFDIAKMATLSVELQAVILDFKITRFFINHIQICRLWIVFLIPVGLWHVDVALKSHKALRITHLSLS